MLLDLCELAIEVCNLVLERILVLRELPLDERERLQLLGETFVLGFELCVLVHELRLVIFEVMQLPILIFDSLLERCIFFC